MAANGREHYLTDIDGRLAGQETVSELELLRGIYYAVRQPRPFLDWKPKELAVAIITILSAVGLVSVGAATTAVSVLAGG